MKKYLFLTIIFIFNIKSFGQNQRFIYEYEFKPDSLHKENVIKELMNLDINKEGSYFYSTLLLDRDSALYAQFEQGKNLGIININLNKIKKSQTRFIISKTYPDYNTVFHTSFNALYLAIKETVPINWTILPDTKTIEGLKVQKAFTKLDGREWNVWFTTEIQIHDGPYKFRGLPGLILSAEDKDEDHKFNIVGIKKQFSRTYINHFKSKEIFLSKQKFNELWNEYKRDPAKNIKLIHGSSEMSETIFFDSNTGNPLTKQDLIKNKEEGDKRFFRNYNNYIERELYK